MSEKIHKYVGPAPNSPIDFTLQLHGMLDIIHVGLQNGKITFWVREDPSTSSFLYKFHCRGTGYEVPEDWIHVGTFFDDPFVWHIFWEPEE